MTDPVSTDTENTTWSEPSLVHTPNAEHVADPVPTVLSICSGVGMLDAAVSLVYPGTRVASFLEWESYAASILLARMEDEALESAPVWCGDLGDFDGRPFLGVVDILTAGLPCQPYSLAGARKGNADHRSFGDGGPLPETLRIISECRPALVFLENVPAWVRSSDQWFRQFGTELCGLGYDLLEPIFLSAGDVGASHERERVFLLAHCVQQRQQVARLAGLLNGERETRGSDPDGCDSEMAHTGRAERWRDADPHDLFGQRSPDRDRGASGEMANAGSGQFQVPGRGPQGRDGTRPAEQEMADSIGVRGERRGISGILGNPEGKTSGVRDQRERDGNSAEHCGPEVAVTGSTRLQGRRISACRSEPAQPMHAVSELSLFAPGPSSPEWADILADFPHLAPAIEPGFRLLDNGHAMVVDASRQDQLRCVGNSVVALQAGLALALLLTRVG